jgi:hypothetical protein
LNRLLKYYCPSCSFERRFRTIEGYRTGSNRFCPNDGTMLRPVGWKPTSLRPKIPRKLKAAGRERPVRPPSPIVAPKQTRLGDIKAGDMDLGVQAVVLTKQLDNRSRWRRHAIAMISDKSGTSALNLWRDQINQVSVGDTIRLKMAFARRMRGRLELSTWEESIEVVRHAG